MVVIPFLSMSETSQQKLFDTFCECLVVIPLSKRIIFFGIALKNLIATADHCLRPSLVNGAITYLFLGTEISLVKLQTEIEAKQCKNMQTQKQLIEIDSHMTTKTHAIDFTKSITLVESQSARTMYHHRALDELNLRLFRQ